MIKGVSTWYLWVGRSPVGAHKRFFRSVLQCCPFLFLKTDGAESNESPRQALAEGQDAHEIPASSEPSAQELRQDAKKHSASSEPTIEGCLLPITSSGDVGAEVPFLRIQEDDGEGHLRPSHGEEDNHIGRNDGRGAANIDLHVPIFVMHSHIPAHNRGHALHPLQDAFDPNNGQAIKASTVGCLLPLVGEEETDADGQDFGTSDAFPVQLKCLTHLHEEKHSYSEHEQQEADEVGLLSSTVKSLLKYAEFWAEDPGKGFHTGIVSVAYLIWKIDVLNAYELVFALLQCSSRPRVKMKSELHILQLQKCFLKPGDEDFVSSFPLRLRGRSSSQAHGKANSKDWQMLQMKTKDILDLG
ncbi:hypothetical protein L7F22_051306 [Adiantum nelumboides]|nr:hypothetical protein [Adiantum nelumboides]